MVMANQNDSFIDEVTEDLRRDRLFGLFRRYGWIAVALILMLVAGVSWREYSQARKQAAAEAWGDQILAAESAGDPQALLDVDPDGSVGRAALAGLLAAGGWVSDDNEDAAVDALRQVTETEGADPLLRDLADLKLVMLQGAQMQASERDAVLTRLSRVGAPFELLALEQKAVALVEAGRNEDAVALIRQIQQKDGLSETLRRRLSEMMIALGVEPEPADTMQAG